MQSTNTAAYLELNTKQLHAAGILDFVLLHQKLKKAYFFFSIHFYVEWQKAL